MARKEQAIERDENGRETHPAFGLVSIHHISGYERLFEAPFRHQHYVRLEIHRADRTDSLRTGDKYVSPRERIVEVDLSELQYAQLIGRPNSGHGVPCTISQIGREFVPTLPAESTKQEEHTAQIKRDVAEIGTFMDDAMSALKAFRDSKTRPTLKDLDTLCGKFEKVKRELVQNLPFVHELFEEAMTKTVTAAKMEVMAFMQQHMTAAGIPQSDAPLLLEEPIPEPEPVA